MNITKKIKEILFIVSGFVFMLPIMFYLNIYELNPIYKEKSN